MARSAKDQALQFGFNSGRTPGKRAAPIHVLREALQYR
jgi:hypothetical protein